MKFGLRKPSLKKSFSARTSALFSRTIKRALIPGYGKKGIGWLTNPKKMLYNKVYGSLTVGVPDILRINSHKNNSTVRNPSIIKGQQSISKRADGLKQCEIILQFTSHYLLDKTLNISILNAITRIHGRINRYLDKGVMYQDDCYQYITKEIGILQQTAKRKSTKYECNIILDIIEQLKMGTEFNQIIDTIKCKYPLWQASIKDKKTSPVTKSISIPKDSQNNYNVIAESEQQKKIIYGLAKLIVGGVQSVKFMNAWIKILSFTEKYSNQQINLFNYLIYVLTAHINQVKREATKNEYKDACEIIRIIKNHQDSSIDEIYNILKRLYIS